MIRHRRLVLLAVALACAAPQGPSPVPPSREPAVETLPLSYDVRTGNGAHAFLLGSVHLARPGDWSLHPRILAALDEASTIVLEVDPTELSEVEVAQLMLEFGMLPPGTSLRDRVSEETWARLEARGRETGMPLLALERFEPWVIGLQQVATALLNAGFDPAEGVEMRVIQGAERDKTLRGLETAAEQFEMLDSLPDELQEQFLLESLEPIESWKDELETIFEKWRSGDAAGLAAVLFAELEADPSLGPFYEATYFARNERMADGIEELLLEVDSAFVMVGAGHLVGERGVPALLAERGFEVEQAR